MKLSLVYEYISEENKEQVEGFDCSDEKSVEMFLKEEALCLHKMKSAITRLYFDNENNLVGYFTLYNDLVHLFREQREKYEWSLPEYKFLPAIKLHYLGIDRRHRNKGYGEYLLREVIQTCSEISKNTGCNFITVEALPNSVGFYSKYGFKEQARKTGCTNMIFKLSEVT